MSFQIGDPIFNHLGEPSLVASGSKAQPDEPRGSPEFVADSDRAVFREQMRHGFIKGLPDESRQAFNGVMDEIRELPGATNKAQALLVKIADLETQGTAEGRHLAGYLRSELAHVSSNEHYHPRYYDLALSKT